MDSATGALSQHSQVPPFPTYSVRETGRSEITMRVAQHNIATVPRAFYLLCYGLNTESLRKKENFNIIFPQSQTHAWQL